VDAGTRARQMVRSARCLLELELEIGEARTLLREAFTFSGSNIEDYYELQLGLGLLARWDGDYPAAMQHMERALALTRAEGQRWREYRCLLGLALTSFALRDWQSVTSLAGIMVETVGKLGDQSCPFASALSLLAELAPAENCWFGRLDAALDELARADDKGDLAFALNAAAYHCLLVGDPRSAWPYARRALHAGTVVRRRSERAFARAVLAHLTIQTNPAHATATFSRLRRLASDPDRPECPRRSCHRGTGSAREFSASSNAGSNGSRFQSSPIAGRAASWRVSSLSVASRPP
jgi:tetratricopeptide (TPR) repeat protein